MAIDSSMRRFWDDRARENPYYFINNRLDYRDTDVEAFWASGERDLDRLLSMLGATVEPTDVVLEIGCGLGRMTRPLARRAQRVIGLDVSAEMLRRARVENPGLENVEWVHGDGESLAPIGTGDIDAVLSFVVLQHIPDPRVVLGYLREIGRVLRSSGWALVQVGTDERVPRRRPWHSPAALRHLVRSLLGRGPRGQYHPAWLGTAVRVADVERTLNEAGMTIERITGEGTQFCLVLARRS